MQEDKPLKNKFEGFSATPKPEVWQRIEAQLDEKPKRRALIWWWSAAAVLILGSTLYFTKSNPKDSNPLSANETSILGRESSDAQSESQIVEIESQESTNTNSEYSLSTNATDENNASSARHNSTNATQAARKKATDNRNSAKRNQQKLGVDRIEWKPIDSEIESVEITLAPITLEILNHIDSTEQINENQVDISKVNLGDSPIENKNSDDYTRSNWSITLHGGAFGTKLNELLYGAPLYGDLSSGIAVSNNEAFQSSLLSVYRHMILGFGVDAAYQLSPRWQMRTGMNVLMYRTKHINENFVQRGSNYFQLALGGDYTLLNNKRFQWQIGTGAGSGLLRNQVVGGVENHWRTEWNINTSFNYSINPKWAIRLQPTSRLIIADTQVDGFGKLSKWFHGANVGVTLRL